MDQQPKLNLKDFLPPWEAELPHAVGDTVFDRMLRGDVGVPVPPSGEYVLGKGSAPIAQDVVEALLVGQGALK